MSRSKGRAPAADVLPGLFAFLRLADNLDAKSVLTVFEVDVFDLDLVRCIPVCRIAKQCKYALDGVVNAGADCLISLAVIVDQDNAGCVDHLATGTTTNTSELSRAGLDSSTPVLSDKTETTTSFDEAKTTTTDTPDNTLTAAFGDDTLTGHEVTEHRLSRSGNIGVTTSQQMIESELELRRTDLLGEFVTGFAKQTLYYVG